MQLIPHDQLQRTGPRRPVWGHDELARARPQSHHRIRVRAIRSNQLGSFRGGGQQRTLKVKVKKGPDYGGKFSTVIGRRGHSILTDKFI